MTETQRPVIAGIDGGGTGCRVAIRRGDTLIADAVGGPANVTSDRDGALRNIRTALNTALNSAGLGRDDITFAHAGLAGVLADTEANTIARALSLPDLTVSDDRRTSVVGALGLSDGVVVSVGTGSFVAHQSAGAVRFVGGWGLHVGDQASGAWLGKQLVETVALVTDGLAERSALIDSVFAEFSGSKTDLIAFARRAEPSDWARFAPRIVDAGTAGDVHGRRILHAGATYLGTCIDRLGAGTDPICLTGSIGPHYAGFLDPRHAKRLIAAQGTALDGALRLADRAANAVA